MNLIYLDPQCMYNFTPYILAFSVTSIFPPAFRKEIDFGFRCLATNNLLKISQNSGFILEWTWYLRSLSSLSAWSTLYPMPFESFKQFPAPWLVAPYDMVDVGVVGRWEIPQSWYPRIPYFRESALLVLFGKGGGFVEFFMAQNWWFFVGAFWKGPEYCFNDQFPKTCSIPKMLSHPLVENQKWLFVVSFFVLLFQRGKSGREAERFLEPLPIGSLVMHRVNNIPTIWSVYINLPFSLLDLSMIMSNLCSMSFTFILCFFTASLWGLAWDYQGHVTLPCCTLAFTFSTVMPKASNDVQCIPHVSSTVSTSGCCLTLFIMSPSMWWAQAYLCCLAWLLDFFNVTYMSPWCILLCLIIVSSMTGRVVANVPF